MSLSSFHCWKKKSKSKYPSLGASSQTWPKFSILEPKIHGLKQNQDLGISTLVHPDFYHQNGFESKFTTLVSLNKKMVFQKPQGSDVQSILAKPKIGRMRTPFDTSKTPKFQKSWRRNVPVDIHNPNFKTNKKQNKGSKKPQTSKIMGKQYSIDTHKTNFFEDKSKEATLSRYLHPNPRGGDIPSILTTEWARRRHSIDTCKTIQQGGDF